MRTPRPLYREHTFISIHQQYTSTCHVREAHKAQIDSKTRAQKWQCSKTEKEIRETLFGLNYDLQYP